MARNTFFFFRIHARGMETLSLMLCGKWSLADSKKPTTTTTKPSLFKLFLRVCCDSEMREFNFLLCFFSLIKGVKVCIYETKMVWIVLTHTHSTLCLSLVTLTFRLPRSPLHFLNIYIALSPNLFSILHFKTILKTNKLTLTSFARFSPFSFSLFPSPSCLCFSHKSLFNSLTKLYVITMILCNVLTLRVFGKEYIDNLFFYICF